MAMKLLILGILVVCGLTVLALVIGLNLVIWAWFVYKRRYGFPMKLVFDEAHIPADVKSGMMPLGAIVCCAAAAGLLCLLLGHLFKLSDLSALGLWLFMIPFLGGVLVFLAKTVPSMFGTPNEQSPTEKKEERTKERKRKGKINLLSQRINEEGENLSLLGLWRRYWRACYRWDIIECEHLKFLT